MNTSEDVVKFLNVFNKPLRIKLKEMGIDDSDYPFSKTIVNGIEDEISQMTVNDFSNLVDFYELGVNQIDDIFWELRDKLYEERSKQ